MDEETLGLRYECIGERDDVGAKSFVPNELLVCFQNSLEHLNILLPSQEF